MAASSSGVEALWGNPALAAHSPREASLMMRSSNGPADAQSDLTAGVVVPFKPIAASIGVFVRYLNFGTFDATNSEGVTTGSFTSTNLVIGATFATTFANRLAAGVTLKQLRLGFACTGDCTQATTPGSTQPTATALDFGAQFFATGDSTVSVGAMMRNVGPRLQVIDAEQADPLPSRASVGVLYAPKIESWKDVRVRFTGDVVSRVSGGTSLGFRVGGEVSYAERLHARAGYVEKGPGEISTPTLGFGLTTGKIRVDVAQLMSDPGGTGNRATFLSLRYDF